MGNPAQRAPALNRTVASRVDRLSDLEHLLVLSERLLQAALEERWDVWDKTYGRNMDLVGRFRNAPPAEPQSEEMELLGRISALNVQVLVTLKEKHEMTLRELEAVGYRKNALSAYGFVRKDAEAGHFGLTC